MPYLKLQTNVTIPDRERTPLLAALSETVARQLGKSEAYVMVALEPAVAMSFAGDPGPAAFLECKSIALPEAATQAISETLCGLVSERLSVPPARIYIEFADAAPAYWGWNGKTF